MTDRKITVYTKTGDNGTTSLFNGSRHPKNSEYFEALGDVDECNSWIGMIDTLYDWDKIGDKTNPSAGELKTLISNIQRRMLDIGIHVATPLTHSNSTKINRAAFDEKEIEELETMIDRMSDQLPELTNFILPSGVFHIVRVSVRKAERRVVSLVKSGDCSESVLKYLNRLSDFMFTLARYTGEKDSRYKKDTSNVP